MSLIQGVGDEVVQFAGLVLVAVVGLFAWWSTNARPGRYRTVVVMRTRPHHPVTVSFRSRPNFMITNNQASSSTSTNEEPVTDTVAVSPSEEVEEAADARNASRVIPLQEMDSIIDADMAMMNNNRLHFYRRLDAPGSVQGIADSTGEESESQEETEPPSSEQIREMDSIVNAMEADGNADCDFFTRPATESNAATTATNAKSEKNEDTNNSTASDEGKVEKKEPHASSTAEGQAQTAEAANTSSSKEPIDEKKILIKLKYLNDTLKEVEGSLDELLKDFKWRHFSVELSGEARVRLIFNGRVLRDHSTLRAAGLHHRAVVHALVHPKRPAAQNGGEQPSGSTTHELVTEGAAQERAWDLENILMTLVSVALTVVWFFRCEYSNMFTASASVALFGLTVFYSVAIFGLYLSDTFHFDRRPAAPAQPQPPQPAPAN